jgi:hypothetical protein
MPARAICIAKRQANASVGTIGNRGGRDCRSPLQAKSDDLENHSASAFRKEAHPVRFLASLGMRIYVIPSEATNLDRVSVLFRSRSLPETAASYFLDGLGWLCSRFLETR